MSEDIVEAITKIGNCSRVVRECEPNVVEPFELKPWMVLRVITAVELFRNEWERISEDT